MLKMIDTWLNPKKIQKTLQTAFSRTTFLKLSALAAGWLFFSSSRSRRAFAGSLSKLPARPYKNIPTKTPLAIATGENPAVLTRRAIEALGGMQLFVKSGDTVVIKPNIGWDRKPEFAANTNPEVVVELVRMARESGAKLVRVFDNPCNDMRLTYQNSGIYESVKAAGGMINFINPRKFQPGDFPDGSLMQDWPIYRDAVECHCFINVPVAKHHGLTTLSLSIKNLMGVCGGMRGMLHMDIDQKLAELAAFIRPELTVIDAYRILLRHGPTGGRLEDVKLTKTIIASADPVLADSYATTLFEQSPADIGYIRAAAAAGLGSMALTPDKILKIKG
jgi:uncharacterized protein (DUF362 family)